MSKRTHCIMSRKIDEGIEFTELGVKILLRRVQGKRVFLYVTAPEEIKITRIKEVRPKDGKAMEGEPSETK